MRTMRKFLITTLGLVMSFTLAPSANAVRPVPNYDFPDVCINIKGTQSILDILWRRYTIKKRFPVDHPHYGKYTCKRTTHGHGTKRFWM